MKTTALLHTDVDGGARLTAAEAKLAGIIAEGATIDAAAKARGVSRETIRTQLKAIFSKTGTNRQTELVRLLGGVGTRL